MVDEFRGELEIVDDGLRNGGKCQMTGPLGDLFMKFIHDTWGRK